MNHSSDDPEIRALFQRLKHADEQHVPPFDDVRERPARKPERRPERRLQYAVACCTVATLLVAFLLARPHLRDPLAESEPRVADDVSFSDPVTAPRDDRLAKVDFDHLHRIVEEHWNTVETAGSIGTPVSSSRTESLLALNLNDSLIQE